MNKTLYDDILEHFETTDKELIINKKYDLSESDGLNEIEDDSTSVWNAVGDLGLKYSITANHEAREGSIEAADYDVATVKWTLWK